jgi:hypothetical protein
VGFIKYALEMGSDTMIYMPSFVNIGSEIQKLTEGMCIHKQTGW